MCDDDDDDDDDDNNNNNNNIFNLNGPSPGGSGYNACI
jgi:hypothetical protein